MTEQEVTDALFDSFLRWSRGQTVGYVNGNTVYYRHDVERYIAKCPKLGE